MKRVKKILMEAARKDREAIMTEGDSFERLLALIAERQKADNAAAVNNGGEKVAENKKKKKSNLLARRKSRAAEKPESKKPREKNLAAEKIKTMVCPDCGGTLLFKSQFGVFMHEDCEKANCWYQANELGECVDNNQKRAERIAKFNSEI